jgi:hypothetical protein
MKTVPLVVLDIQMSADNSHFGKRVASIRSLIQYQTRVGKLTAKEILKCNQLGRSHRVRRDAAWAKPIQLPHK